MPHDPPDFMPETDHTPTSVIVNPNSAGGRTGQVWPRIRPILEESVGPVEVLETNAVGHGTSLAADALRSGYRNFIAVGGDGTLNEVVNGLFADGRPDPGVVLGLIPQGTGSDFRRTAGLPLDPAAAVEIIRNRHTRPLDIMRVNYREPGGTEATRFAVNVASFGLGGATALRANRSSKRFGGRFTYLTALAWTTIGFRGDTVTLELDDETWPDVLVTNVAIGNGQFHGAGMRVCPHAIFDDGIFEVTVIEKLSLWNIVRNRSLLFNGKLYEHPKIHHRRTTSLVAQSVGQSAVELDGEPLGYLPLKVTLIPQALNLIVP
jgi:YegS/Rv2252/BmrU family lipid kinase